MCAASGGREDVTFRQKEVGPLPHAGKCLMPDWGTLPVPGILGRGESMGVPGGSKDGGAYSGLVFPSTEGLEVRVEGCSP